MAQWIKTLAAKAYNLGSSPINNMVEGENSLKLSSDFHLSASCVRTHAYIHDTYTDTHDIYTRGERKILFPQTPTTGIHNHPAARARHTGVLLGTPPWL